MTDNKSQALSALAPQGSLASFQEIERAARAIVASGMFGIKSEPEAISLMLIAQSEGRHYATAARDYHVISGRPSLKADTMLARFQAAGGKVRWITLSDKLVSAEFSHPQGGSATIDWDDSRVERAGLNKSPNHQKFPRAMKRARVISEGVRTVFPGVLGGMYTPEEVQDIAYHDSQAATITEAPRPTEESRAQDVAADLPPESRLTDEEIEEHCQELSNAKDETQLRAAFKSAWKHAKEAKDETASIFFKGLYDSQKLKSEVGGP